LGSRNSSHKKLKLWNKIIRKRLENNAFDKCREKIINIILWKRDAAPK